MTDRRPDAGPLPSAAHTPEVAAAALDASHRANRRRALIPLALMAVGVLAMATRALLRDDGAGGGRLTGFVVLVAVVGVGVGIVLIRMNSLTADRHAAVRALRRHAEVIEVWGAAGLRDALIAEGVHSPPLRGGQGTALTMVLTAEGVELWAGTRQPQMIYTVAWADLGLVVEGAGVVAGDGAKPAVVLVTRTGNGLVLLPARNPTGSLRTAPVAVVRALVARLEERRAAA